MEMVIVGDLYKDNKMVKMFELDEKGEKKPYPKLSISENKLHLIFNHTKELEEFLVKSDNKEG